MRKIRPRRNTYYSDAIDDIVAFHNGDQFDYIRHTVPFEKEKPDQHLTNVEEGHQLDENVYNKQSFPRRLDSTVCPELCYMRRIPSQPLGHPFKGVHDRTDSVYQFLGQQSTTLKEASLSRIKYSVIVGLQCDDHLLRCSGYVEEMSQHCSSNDMLKGDLLNLPQLLDLTQTDIFPIHIKTYDDSEFSTKFNLVLPKENKLGAKGNRPYRVKLRSDDTIMHLHQRILRGMLGDQQSTVLTVSPKSKLQSWLQSKKQMWQEQKLLRDSKRIIESQLSAGSQQTQSVYHQYLSSTHDLFRAHSEVLRAYFICIDNKLPDCIHTHPNNDSRYPTTVVNQIQISDMIKWIDQKIVPNRGNDWKRKIIAEKSIHSFSSFYRNIGTMRKTDIVPVGKDFDLSISQYRPSLINNVDPILPRNMKEDTNVGTPKITLLHSSVSQLILIQKRRALGNKKMVLPFRNVFRYRTISRIMSAYRIRGGVILPHSGDIHSVQPSVPKASIALSSAFKRIVMDLWKNNKNTPKLFSRRQTTIQQSRNKVDKSNLICKAYADKGIEFREIKAILCPMNCQNFNKQTEPKMGSSYYLLDRFEGIQSIFVEVRGELLHLQTKSSEIGRTMRKGFLDNSKKSLEDLDTSRLIHREETCRQNNNKKRHRLCNENEQKKKQRMKRKQKRKKEKSGKKRKRKTERKENGVNIIEVPSLKVGETPMIISHAKYEVTTSIQNDNNVNFRKTFQRDVKVRMSSNQEVSQLPLPTLPIDLTSVALPGNVNDGLKKGNIVPQKANRDEIEVPETFRPYSRHKAPYTIVNTSTVPRSAHNKKSSPEILDESAHLAYDHNKCAVGLIQRNNSITNESLSTHTPSRNIPQKNSENSEVNHTTTERTQLNLLCSENFVETWSQAAAELSSGNWIVHTKNDSTYDLTSISQNKIQLNDCILLDDCKVDIEFLDYAALKIVTWNSASTNQKASIKEIVNLVSCDRYNTIYCLFIIQSMQSYQNLSNIANLQNAIVKQRGCPCNYFYVQYAQPGTLSAVIATIASRHTNNNLLDALSIDSKMIERARFLLSLLPTLTASESITLLSQQNDTLNGHIRSLLDAGNDSVVRHKTIQQMKAVLVACLKHF